MDLARVMPHLHFPSRTADAAARVSQKLGFAQVSQTTEARLQITTRDGDTVTLTASRDVQALRVDSMVSRRSDDDTPDSRVRLRSLSSEQEFSLVVEGSLDSEERQQITDLVRRVSQGLQQFSRGNLQAAEAILAGGAYDELAGFSAEFEQETVVTAGELLRRTAGSAPGPTAVPMPVIPASEPPVAGEPGPAQPAPVLEDDAGSTAMADAISRAAGRSQVAHDRLTRLLGQLMERFASSVGHDGERAAVDAVRTAFARSLSGAGVGPRLPAMPLPPREVTAPSLA